MIQGVCRQQNWLSRLVGSEQLCQRHIVYFYEKILSYINILAADRQPIYFSSKWINSAANCFFNDRYRINNSL